MRQALTLVALVLLIVALFAPAAWAATRSQDRTCDPAACPVCKCVDANGDGICDNCGTCIPKGADDDGDGIPNGQDPDYKPPKDGSGRR